mmetsp:Transcript_27782/g.51875  ORF Transcript_27782/g.51875 Transcript_27782/m.51875 type:complete len:209 (-) Transcript_27782:294-920(-)
MIPSTAPTDAKAMVVYISFEARQPRMVMGSSFESCSNSLTANSMRSSAARSRSSVACFLREFRRLTRFSARISLRENWMRDSERACNSNCSFVADPYQMVLAKMLPTKRRSDVVTPTVTSSSVSVNNPIIIYTQRPSNTAEMQPVYRMIRFRNCEPKLSSSRRYWSHAVTFLGHARSTISEAPHLSRENGDSASMSAPAAWIIFARLW